MATSACNFTTLPVVLVFIMMQVANISVFLLAEYKLAVSPNFIDAYFQVGLGLVAYLFHGAAICFTTIGSGEYSGQTVR